MNQHTLPVVMPKLIGICGNPRSGKSEVQSILSQHFHYHPIDDAHPVREFAVINLGLTWADVRTQGGKARSTEILGKTWEHRDILGTLANHLEDMFGDDIMPYMATRNLAPGNHTLGSVRRDQGAFIKSMGGVVIEVVNPIAPPSPYEFDRYDHSVVDYTIHNTGLIDFPTNPARGLKALSDEVTAMMGVLCEVKL